MDRPTVIALWAVGGLLLLVLLGGVALFTFVVANRRPPPNPTPVDLGDFLARWNKNPLATRDAHPGGIIFTGRVTSIRSFFGSIDLRLTPAAGGLHGTAEVSFDGDYLQGELRDYPKGSLITVEAAITSQTGSLSCQARRIIPQGGR